ncbi:hypothetical protein D3C86_1030510 [compost metagenome]
MFLALIFSCKKDFKNNQLENEVVKNKTLNVDSAKKQFAIILSKAVNEDISLREFIKNESLKQIDNDFDVFYAFVRDKIVSKNETFRTKLVKYADNESKLKEIEDCLPLLTIFVPKLPTGFSAEKWNTSNENPLVTTENTVKNQQEFFGDGHFVLSLNRDEIPAFPTLVIKNNERIKVKDEILLKSGSANSLSKDSYAFVDPAFDGTIKTKGDPVGGTNHLIDFPVGQVDPILLNAYDLMGVSNSDWQRDHIYYGLNHDPDTKGPLNISLKETIRSIRFNNSAIGFMRDQDDPTYVGEKLGLMTPNLKWTDGNFEFRFEILINNKLGLGTTITRMVSIDPDLLFYLEYEYRFKVGNIYNYARIKTIHNNKVGLNIPLINWDLENNGMAWKFYVSEIDDQQTSTRTETSTMEFATNFGFNTTLGKVTKYGLNFGASAKSTKTNTYTLTTQLNSDDLGTLELFFSDPVIRQRIAGSNLLDMGTISNGLIELVVMPMPY